jgi:hypothetical protein
MLHQVMWHACMLRKFTINDPLRVIIHFLEFFELFFNGEYDMG